MTILNMRQKSIKLMQNKQSSQYGACYWYLDSLPISINAWAFKANHICGNQPYHSIQPTPSGLTLRLVEKGHWIIKMNNQTMPAHPGDLFCAYPDYLIDFQTRSRNWEWYEIQFNGSKAREFLEAFGCDMDTPVSAPKDRSQARQLFRQIYAYMSSQERSVWKMQALIYNLLDACNPTPPPKVPQKSNKLLMRKILDLIEMTPTTKMNVTELADRLHVDRTTLRRFFKIELSMNPIEFIKKIRLERAMELLVATDHSISTIARLSGFSDPKYFIRCFREKNDLSPRKWRISRCEAHQSRKTPASTNVE